VDDTTKRLNRMRDMVTKGFYSIAVFAEGAAADATPERIFSPFFRREDAERKKQELELVCQQQGWQKRFEIRKRSPPPRLSDPDESLLDDPAATDDSDAAKSKNVSAADAQPGPVEYRTRVYHIVSVYPQPGELLASPEKRFGPFFEIEAAEAKRHEIESVCQQNSWRKKVVITTHTPPPPLLPADQVYEG
jgi:hypothetical protein